MTRSAIRVAVLLALLAGLGGAVWLWTRPEPVAVALHTVGTGTVARTVANTRVGTVMACRRALLAPATGGEVATLAVREGAAVHAGELLLETWNEDLLAQINLAAARRLAAEAQVKEACATAAGADRELGRLRRLREQGMVSEEQVDVAHTTAQAQRAACEARQAQLSVHDAEIRVARAALEKTRIRAPFDGVVAEVNAEVGEYVTPSPPGIPTLPAIDLLDLGCLYVSAPIDEVDAPPIVPAMPVCVTLDAFPEPRCSAVVRRIAPYVLDRQKQARTVEVEVELTSPDALAGLRPGYSADIEIELEVREDVVRVPTEAVLEGGRVLVYDAARGVLAARAVETGLANWRFTEVRAGLEPGERIVLSVGRAGVAAGAAAVPEEGPGPAAR